MPKVIRKGLLELSTILTDVIESFTEDYSTKDKIQLLRDLQSLLIDRKADVLNEISVLCFDLAGDTLCPYCGNELKTETYNDTEALEYFGTPVSQPITFRLCDSCGIIAGVDK